MRPDVIELYGVRFPVAQRPVVRRAVTPFPQRITVGDYRSGDHVVESELVFSDFTGGIGVLVARPERGTDRYWWGTLDGRYQFLTLPPAAEKRGNPGLVDRFIAYNGSVHALAGNTVYRWDGSGWEALFSYTGVVTDVVVYDGILVILTGSALYMYDGATGQGHEWQAALVNDPIAQGYAACVWDDKLFLLGIDNVMRWTVADLRDCIQNQTLPQYQEAGRLLLPSGWCQQLLLYTDQTGEVGIHAITREGLYYYDFATERFYQTPFTWPVSDEVGRAAVWRGQLLVPIGQTVYLYNGSLVQTIGPDRDDGLPAEVRGRVKACVPGHGYWFAVLATRGAQTGSSLEDDWDTTLPNLPEGWFPGARRTAAVLVSPQLAYHTLTLYTDVTDVGDVVAVATDDGYGLWVSTTEGVEYIALPTGLHNPLQNPTQRFAEKGALITSWWDMGWRNLEKLALSVVMNAVIPPGGEIRVSIGYDGDDAWEPVAVMNTTGRQRFRIGGIEGRKFRMVRFLLEFERGPDPSFAPYLIDMVFTYLRTPRLLFGWEMSLQLTDPYCREQVGVSAQRLVEELENIAMTREAGTLRYIDEGGNEVERRVFLTELVATELVGPYREGRYQVSVVELES